MIILKLTFIFYLFPVLKASSRNSSDPEEDKSTYLDALASTLARLDEDAYKKAVFKDANALLENIVFPMSFPWNHPGGPVIRTIPRDIDEMPSIQTMDDDAEHELCSLKHSNFDLGKFLFNSGTDNSYGGGGKMRAVARRADNPGIVELITCAPPLSKGANDLPIGTAYSPEARRSILLRDPIVELVSVAESAVSSQAKPTGGDDFEELSYRMFEDLQEKKRRKLESGLARLKTSMISVRVGSTSSRPTLFDKKNSQVRAPLLLPAVLPQDFRPMAKGRSSSSRVDSGRSKLIWLEKLSMRTSHRVSYTSYLTNEKVESGNHKRPRDVLVGIRVNGKLLTTTHTDAIANVTSPETNVVKKKRDGKPSSLYSTKIVSEALENSCSGTEPRLGMRQCSMDTEELTRKILASEIKRGKSIGWNTKESIQSPQVTYTTPRIDCMPTEDGLIHVVCTSPGKIAPTNVEEVLNTASKKETAPLCSVCWRETSTSGEHALSCSDCGVVVHMSCCQSADTKFHPRWKCSVCAHDASSSTGQSKQKEPTGSSPTANNRNDRRSTKPAHGNSPGGESSGLSCLFCPHRGGSMSLLKRGGKDVWAHDVCRIWSEKTAEFAPSPRGGGSSSFRGGHVFDHTVCVLCGTPNATGGSHANGIVKCAASGCSIRFHPMCALFLSKCEERRHGELNGSVAQKEPNSSHTRNTGCREDPTLATLLEDDKHLCRQYSLRFIKCSIPPSGQNSTRLPSAALLPVCFCGIHNPHRERSLYGLYPGGQQLDEQVMRIPAKRYEGKKT